MLAKKHSAMGVVAVLVTSMLALFGINRIGGETWTSAAAESGAGVRAYTGTFTPPPAPVMRAFLVPLLMVLVVIAVAVLAAILKGYARRADDDEAPPRLPTG